MKTVVITGATGGLGMATTLFLAERGWKVFALDLDCERLEKIRAENIIPVQVDVTDQGSVRQAVEEVRKSTDALDGIINFAGILLMGSVIEKPAEDLQRILEINLLGMYRINRSFFPMLEQGKGRIVNVSSEVGVLSPAPFMGFYTLSKHAVEIYSDALRRELKFLGIPVIKIRPGAFRTSMQGGVIGLFEQTRDSSELFRDNIERGRSMAEQGIGGAKDPAVLSGIIHKALTVRKPRLVYKVNLNRKLQFLSALPRRWQDLIYHRVLRAKKG